MPATPTKIKRPFGVYAIIALLAFRALAVYLDLVRVREHLSPIMIPDLHNDAYNLALVGVILVVAAAICTGLFLLKRWAWIAAMILIGAFLLAAIVYYLSGGKPYVPMLLDVISVFYLNQRSVQAAFEGRAVPREVAP